MHCKMTYTEETIYLQVYKNCRNENNSGKQAGLSVKNEEDYATSSVIFLHSNSKINTFQTCSQKQLIMDLAFTN